MRHNLDVNKDIQEKGVSFNPQPTTRQRVEPNEKENVHKCMTGKILALFCMHLITLNIQQKFALNNEASYK